MSRTLQNTIANFAGLVSSAGLTLLFSIIYFRILGSENFGLISFCTTVLLIGNLFVDLGLGRTIIRELARREHNPELGQEMRDALFTLQSIHLGLAFTCGAVIAAASSWLATNWLNRDSVQITEATHAIALLGVVAALQLPREFCRSALSGLQRQVLSNLLATAFSALRGAATIAALFLIAPTPIVFLVTQVAVSILETGSLFVAVWIKMPRRERRTRFDTRILKDIWAFAVGDGLAILLGVGMTFGDRILLSSLLPLDVFGNYSLAIMIAEIILRIISPFSSAYFPHFADLIARDDKARLSEDYNHVGVVAAAIIVPAALILIGYAPEVLQLVTGQSAIASTFAALLAIRTLGNLTISLQYLPHTLQLAAGVSTTALYVNIFNLGIYLPGILYFTPIYGFLVPAVLWLVIVAVQTPTMIFVTHRIALKGQAWEWVRESILQPVLLSGTIVAVSAYLKPQTVSWFSSLPWTATTYVAAVISTLLASGLTRPTMLAVSNRVVRRAFHLNNAAG
jgi:O-antigen/teichoic acid export membrane protein